MVTYLNLNIQGIKLVSESPLSRHNKGILKRIMLYENYAGCLNLQIGTPYF